MDIYYVSKLGFGTSQIGGPSLINGEFIGARPLPRREAVDILKFAYDNGINFYDTSDKYGDAEELLGETFSGVRDKVVIATKCGLTGAGGRDFSIPNIDRCIEGSLRRLRTDYIDIFQLAKPKPGQVTDEILSFFERKIEEGKVRYLGISTIGSEDGLLYLSKETIRSFQIFYNALFTDNRSLARSCAQRKRFVIVRSPLNSGILSGSYSMDTKFDKVDSRSRYFHGDLLKERLECVEKIKSRFGLSSNEVLEFSLNLVLSDDDVNVVIPAASKIEQLETYLKVFREGRRLSRAELDDVVNFAQGEIKIKHGS